MEIYASNKCIVLYMSAKHHGVCTPIRHKTTNTCLILCCSCFCSQNRKSEINFFSTYSSSSVRSDHTDQPSIPTCISEPLPLTTLSLVHYWSFLKTPSDHSRPGPPYESCCDPVLQQHNLGFFKLDQILTLLTH